MRTILAGAALAMMVFGASTARAAEGVAPKAAFETLKGLAGEWSGPDGMKIVYKVTAGGSTVMETLFPGQPQEMISMYHMDGDSLKMTHYCMIGNQPRTKLDAKASKSDLLVFLFDGGTNLDPAKDTHMHDMKIKIKDAKHIETECNGYQEGKSAGCHKFELTRD